jgi:short subunit fatty acids transporter
MWFLSFIPSWYVHIIPLSALAIIFASMVLKVIPFISTYYIPIRIIGFVLLCFGIFFEGGLYMNQQWTAKVKEMEEKIAVAEAKSKEENIKIVEKFIVKQNIVREKGEEVIKYIDKEIIKYDVKFAPGGQCEIPKEFVEAVNKVAKDGK